MVLERIDSPRDLKALSRPEIDILSREIRAVLIDACAKNGGHLGPNLGVVELTLALHRVLDAPKDKIVWDVSHQVYVQKLLTGRRDRIHTIRKGGGLSGFAMRSESEYDCFGAGHASTSISAALGMAQARELAGTDETIVAVIGDGALTGGLAYEALNNAGQLKCNFIVILNDNEMSIAPNVGAIDRYLGHLRAQPLFNAARDKAKDILGHMPFGDAARKALSTWEEAALRFASSEQQMKELQRGVSRARGIGLDVELDTPVGEIVRRHHLEGAQRGLRLRPRRAVAPEHGCDVRSGDRDRALERLEQVVQSGDLRGALGAQARDRDAGRVQVGCPVAVRLERAPLPVDFARARGLGTSGCGRADERGDEDQAKQASSLVRPLIAKTHAVPGRGSQVSTRPGRGTKRPCAFARRAPRRSGRFAG